MVWLSNFLESHRVSLPESYEDEDLSLQGKRLKGYVLGAEGLLADWYWMWALQYFGGKVVKTGLENLNLDDLRPLNPRLLYPMLDISTDLDPHFIAPYSFGAILLPAIDTQKAIALTEKGIANNPGEWRLQHYLGYIYWRERNYEKAAEIYQKASQIPGSPDFLDLMTAKMKTEGGSRATAREMYTQMLTEAQNEQTKISAEIRLMELDSLDERDAIKSALDTFKQSAGRCPNNWNEILAPLAKVSLPSGKDFRVDAARNLVDPSGAPYILDREKCEARIDRSRSKIPAF